MNAPKSEIINQKSKIAFGVTDLALISMAFIWGMNFVVVKTTFAEIAPFAFMALRFLTASVLFLLVIQLRRQGFNIPRHAWGRVAIAGIIGTTLYQPLFLSGLALSQASNSALILASTPAFVVLLNRFLHKERFSTRGWLGLAFSFSGIGLIVLSSGNFALTPNAWLGDLLVLGATICWSLYAVFTAPLLKRYSSLSVAALATIFGTIPLLFISVPAVLDQNWAQVSVRGWLGLIYSASFAIVLAYILWNVGVQRIGSARTAIYNNLTPVLATFAAAIFLGEALTWFKILGALVIFVGLYLARTANVILEPEG